MAVTYSNISNADRLNIARDALRGKESDHFRLSILNEADSEQRLDQMAQEIESLQGVVSRLESEASGG